MAVGDARRSAPWTWLRTFIISILILGTIDSSAPGAVGGLGAPPVPPPPANGEVLSLLRRLLLSDALRANSCENGTDVEPIMAVFSSPWSGAGSGVSGATAGGAAASTLNPESSIVVERVRIRAFFHGCLFHPSIFLKKIVV